MCQTNSPEHEQALRERAVALVAYQIRAHVTEETQAFAVVDTLFADSRHALAAVFPEAVS